MEEAVDVIRECSRAALTFSRRAHRDEETDGRRHIVNENITPAVIADIAHRLKSKNAVSSAELRTLKNSILDDPKHIEVVLNTHCAVRGLVRELTGQEARKQSEAVGCLCNLALGDERACAALAKAAGPYLLTALTSLHTDLAITCAWTLGNVAGGGTKPSTLLTEQGAVAALATMVTSPLDDVSDAAAGALLHFAHQMGDDFRKEHVSQILQAVSQTRFTRTSLHLLSILSCHDDFNQLLDEELFQKLLEHSIQSMENITKNYYPFLYAIRTLANITLNDQLYSVIIGYFSLKVYELKKILTMNEEVVKSLLWFLGNLFNYNSENEFFNVLLS